MSRFLPVKSAETEPPRKPGMKLLPIFAVVLLAAFGLLLIVGFENVLALFRYRVTLFLVLGPLFGLFLWCAYKAIGPKNGP